MKTLITTIIILALFVSVSNASNFPRTGNDLVKGWGAFQRVEQWAEGIDSNETTYARTQITIDAFFLRVMFVALSNLGVVIYLTFQSARPTYKHAKLWASILMIIRKSCMNQQWC